MWDRIQSKFKEQIWEHEEVVKLRQKFSELDVQTQSYVIIGSFAFFVLLLLGSFFGFWKAAYDLKNDLAELESNIRYVQTVAVKIEEMKAMVRTQALDPMLKDLDPQAPIGTFMEKAIQKSLIPKASVDALDSLDNTAEIKLSKISLRQLVRLLFMVEQSKSGSAVDRLFVDTKDDPEGYLWAELKVHKGGK